MGQFVDGRYISDKEAAILNAMVQDAKNDWNSDLNDSQAAAIRMFYLPVARRMAEAQDQLGLILDSAQIEHASEDALDLLCALIGVSRQKAKKADGTVTVSLDTRDTVDHNIPKGTVVATNDPEDPVRFVTTKAQSIEGPSTETDSTTYSTTSTSYQTQTDFVVDVTYRDTLDVSADIRTTDATTPVAADLRIQDATNGTTVHTDSTTSGTFVTSGPVTYDVSGLEGKIALNYQLKSNSSTVSVELTNATLDKQAEIASDAPITAEKGGVDGNVGANTIVNFPDGEPFPGAEVTNSQQTEGGSDREDDDELRERAMDELANGARATGPALVSQVQALDGVTDVSIFINDTDSTNGRGHGLPPHSFELVVTCDETEATLKEIAQAIMDTKAAGDISEHGVNGQALDSNLTFVNADGEILTTLPNEQTHPVGYSLSQKVYIYADVDINVDADTYEGDTEVMDAIVDYIGGWRNSGFEQDGEIGTSDDVVHASVFSAVMSIEGVVDVNHVYIGKAANPTGTANIAIAQSEQAITDARDGAGYLTVATTQV